MKLLFNLKRHWHNLFTDSALLWLDDVRQAPKGWYWAVSVEEAKERLVSCWVEEASFDHDLGLDETGYDLVKWLAEMKEGFGMDFWPEKRPSIHSMNPIGRANMIATIQRYGGY